MSVDIQDPRVDRLWGIPELSVFLGYTESAVRTLASSAPERLPPRVAGLGRVRWSPPTVRAWVAAQSAPAGKKGRPRLVNW